MQKSLLVVAISAVFLAGCAQPGPDRQAAYNAAIAQINSCGQAVRARPEFASFNFTAGGAPTAADLANDSYPSPDHAKATAAVFDAQAPCRQDFLSAVASPPVNRPDIAQIYAETFSQSALVVADYSKGNMTVAQYARRKQEITDAVRSRLIATDAQAQQATAQAEQAAAQAAANRTAAAAAILGVMRPQPQTIYVKPCTIYGQIANAC
jgi:hypothetical protein